MGAGFELVIVFKSNNFLVELKYFLLKSGMTVSE